MIIMTRLHLPTSPEGELLGIASACNFHQEGRSFFEGPVRLLSLLALADSDFSHPSLKGIFVAKEISNCRFGGLLLVYPHGNLSDPCPIVLLS